MTGAVRASVYKLLSLRAVKVRAPFRAEADVSPSRLFSFLLTESHAGTAAVSIDEVDACVLEGPSNDIECGAPWLGRSRL
jgi:hypothetical protein